MSSFGFKNKKQTKKKWSDEATSDLLLPATSVIPQPWGLFSWTLPARGIYSPCHFMPNRVLQHTKSHQNQLRGHYYLYWKMCLHPKVALLEVTFHLLQSPSHRKTSLYHLGLSVLFGEMRHLPSTTLLRFRCSVQPGHKPMAFSPDQKFGPRQFGCYGRLILRRLFWIWCPLWESLWYRQWGAFSRKSLGKAPGTSDVLDVLLAAEATFMSYDFSQAQECIRK